MDSISNLPAELKLSIVEILNPDDCFNCAIVSKDFWQLCEPVVNKHKALNAKYGYICTEPEEHTLWNLLNDVLDKPYLSQYVKEVQLDSQRENFYDTSLQFYDIVGPSSLRPPVKDVMRYISAAENIPYLCELREENQGHHDAHRRNESIEKGAGDPVMAIVLTLLPNLKVLRFVPVGDGFWFLNAIKRVVATYSLSGPTPNIPFQHLRKVQVSHYDTEMSMAWKWVYFLVQLPSLQWCTGHMLGGMANSVENDRSLQPVVAPTSNVTALQLSNSNLDSEVLTAILSNFKNLQFFEYENGGHIVSDASYDPRKMIAALLQYCSHSLKKLVLENDDDERYDEEEEGPHPIHHLSGFAKLKVLRCALRDVMLDDDEEYGPFENVCLDQGFFTKENDMQQKVIFNPHRLFPPTLERLHIDCRYGDLSEADKFNMLEILLESKKDSLPNLCQVYLAMNLDASERLANFKARAAEQGIEFKPIARKTNSIWCGFGSAYSQ